MKNKLLLPILLCLIFGLMFYFIVLNSPERQIKKTVDEFWTCFENREYNKSVEIFYNGGNYYGALQMNYFYLKKNYEQIKPQITTTNELKIQDTLIFGTERKYVRYKFINKNPEIKPMVLTFIFWKEKGYNKILNPIYLANFLDWRKKR